jgi:arylsulfatase
MGDWKAVRQNMHKGNTTLQLFNLAKDVSETMDVAKDNPRIVERMLAIMREQHVDSKLFPFKAIDGK